MADAKSCTAKLMKAGKSFYVDSMKRVRNEEVCRKAGIEMELVNRANESVLRWFGHN